MKKKLFVYLFLILFSYSYSQTLHIYGGNNHNEYLGCLNCNSYDKNSIWNEYSTYGSKYNRNSIWNDYGTYGSKYSTNSPWNNYASNPPVIVDKDGNFYGYLAVNQYQSKRANFDLALILYEHHEKIKDDVSKWYDAIFQ